MLPEICKIGPFTVYAYGLFLAVAFVIGSVLAGSEAKRQGVNPDIIFNLAFTAFISGVIGSRLFYIAENLGYYMKSPLEIIMLQHGGLSWFGGLFMGGFAGILYVRKKGLNLYRTLDLLMPFVALAQAIGRVGCLLNGCCYGKESSFGIYFPVHQAVLAPVQIYSSLVLIFIFIALRSLQGLKRKDGQIFFAYLLLYSLKRFFIEFWRADNEIIFMGLTLFQVISIVIFFFSFFKLASILKSKK